MSSDNAQIINTSSGIKRQYSDDGVESTKKAKRDKTREPDIDEKSKGTAKNSDERKSDNELLEKGDIVFMYKPKLNVNEAVSFDDVQLFHVLLIPDEHEKLEHNLLSKKRLIKIGKKKLPSTGKEKFWAFVEKTDNDMEKVEEKLETQTYETVTVGTRTIKADRIAGKGKYIIVKHDRNRSIIGYVLESPSKIGDVQNVFNITKEASFTITVKNPIKKNPRTTGSGLSPKAEFPDELQKKFGLNRWLPAEPEILDIPGCEMLWIGSSTDDLGELLGKLGRGIEKLANSQVTPTEVMQDIQLDEKKHPTQALVDGQWPRVDDAAEINNQDKNKNTESKNTAE